MTNEPDSRFFVNEQCELLGINTSLGRDWQDVRANAHRFAIAQSISVIESFLRDLTREYRFYRGLLEDTWTNSIGGEQLNALSALTQNLPKVERLRARACPEYDLIQYYRVVRNRIVHRTALDTTRQLRQLLNKHKPHFEACYRAVPEDFDLIGYNDFLLLTRATKYYVQVLNDVCALEPKDI